MSRDVVASETTGENNRAKCSREECGLQMRTRLPICFVQTLASYVPEKYALVNQNEDASFNGRLV
jgi:hypothetical protein